MNERLRTPKHLVGKADRVAECDPAGCDRAYKEDDAANEREPANAEPKEGVLGWCMNAVRASTHIYNMPGEVDRLIESVRHVAVAFHAAAGNFEAQAEEIASELLAGHEVKKIYLRELGAAPARASVIAAFDQGASVMSYLGHGGIHLWASEGVFDNDAVSSLNVQPLQPLLLTMNCLNGYFHFPYFDSLAEKLLKSKERGAVAAFSPTGLSQSAAAQRYHKAILKEILSGAHARLGDAVAAAQAAYLESGDSAELLGIYHLLGDPALSLR